VVEDKQQLCAAADCEAIDDGDPGLVVLDEYQIGSPSVRTPRISLLM